jgi:hypothetical protein
MRWEGIIARMEGEDMCVKVWWGDLWKRDNFEDIDVDVRKILK